MFDSLFFRSKHVLYCLMCFFFNVLCCCKNCLNILCFFQKMFSLVWKLFEIIMFLFFKTCFVIFKHVSFCFCFFLKIVVACFFFLFTAFRKYDYIHVCIYIYLYICIYIIYTHGINCNDMMIWTIAKKWLTKSWLVVKNGVGWSWGHILYHTI